MIYCLDQHFWNTCIFVTCTNMKLNDFILRLMKLNDSISGHALCVDYYHHRI